MAAFRTCKGWFRWGWSNNLREAVLAERMAALEKKRNSRILIVVSSAD